MQYSHMLPANLQITWTARVMSRAAQLDFGVERTVTFLPLSHTAAQLDDIYVPMEAGACVYFARPDAFKVLPSKFSFLPSKCNG